MPQAGRWSCGLPLARPRDIADMPAVVDKQKPHCRFPGIARAALEISYDNGGIDADRTEAKLLRQLDRFLERCGIDSRSEEHTSELQSIMRISYAVFCLKKKKKKN